MKIAVLVKTLSGSSAEALGSKVVPAGAKIYADSGDTVHIGPEGVEAGTGFLLPTSPGTALALGELFNIGKTSYIDLSKVYAVGANTDVIRVLYFQED